jgi:hypothetical protein
MTTIRLALALGCLAALVSAGSVFADDDKRVEERTTTTTTTTTNQGSGTVSQLSPSRIVIRTTETSNPVTYTQTKTTTYVDEMGNPVAIETVRTGMPVTVFYDKSGNQMTATRVVVQKKTVTEEDD